MKLARDLLLAPFWFLLAGAVWLISKVPESWFR